MEEQNKSEWNLILPILILVSFLFVVLRMNPDSIGFDIRFSSFLIVAVPLAVFPAILIIGQICKGKDLWKRQLKEGGIVALAALAITLALTIWLIVEFFYIPHITWVFLKAWFIFIFFVWFRAALHRVRTDQILEFGWRWLLPLSLVNLAMATVLRLWVYDGVNEEWPILVPILITSISLALFVLLSIDEDPEALEAQIRPFSVQTVDVASPGQHRD